MRVRANVPRIVVSKLTVEQCTKPLLGFWVTSANRRNMIWPVYLKDLGDENQAVLDAWRRICEFEVPNPRYAILNFQVDLPQQIIELVTSKRWSGQPLTKQTFSDLYPEGHMIEANADFILGADDPVVHEYVEKCINVANENGGLPPNWEMREDTE